MDPVVVRPNDSGNGDGDDSLKTRPADNNQTPDSQVIEPVSEVHTEPVETPVVQPPPSPSDVPEVPDRDATPSLAIPPKPDVKPPKRKRKFLTILALLLVLAGAAYGTYYYLNRQVEDTIVADETVKDIEHLTIGSDLPPFNAFYPDPNYISGPAYGVNFQLYEGLVGFKNADSVVPLLAQSWSNPDDKTWVFTLKQNVKFHDGKTVTAADVARSLNMAKDTDIPSLLYQTIVSVEATGDNQVTVKTTAADPLLLNKLALIMIVGEAKVHDAYVGTGAFKLSADIEPTDISLVLDAFDDYHNGRPSVRKVSYTAYDSFEALVAAAEKGEIDLTDYAVDQKLADKTPAGFRKVELPTPDVNLLSLNAEAANSPLADKRVRQAIVLGVDVDKIMDVKSVAGRQLSQLTIPANFGFNAELEPAKRNVEEAKKLLSQAGHGSGLTLDFLIRPTADGMPLFEAFKTQLAEIGITLRAQEATDGNDFFAKLDGGETDLVMYNVSSALFDSYDIFAFNFQGVNYQADDFDAIMSKANATLNTEERKTHMQTASKFLVDDAAAVPLYNPDGFYFLRDSINFEKGDIPGLLNPGYLYKLSSK